MRLIVLILCILVVIAIALPLLDSASWWIRIQKLEPIGSDHFPILIEINYEPDDNNTKELKTINSEEEAAVEENIENGMKESPEK